MSGWGASVPELLLLAPGGSRPSARIWTPACTTLRTSGRSRELLLPRGHGGGRLFPSSSRRTGTPPGEEDRDARGDPEISFPATIPLPLQGASADVAAKKPADVRRSGPGRPYAARWGEEMPSGAGPVLPREGRLKRRGHSPIRKLRGARRRPPPRPPEARPGVPRGGRAIARGNWRAAVTPPRRPEAAGRRSMSKGRSRSGRPAGFGGEKRRATGSVTTRSTRIPAVPKCSTRFRRPIAAAATGEESPDPSRGAGRRRTGSPRPRSAVPLERGQVDRLALGDRSPVGLSAAGT